MKTSSGSSLIVAVLALLSATSLAGAADRFEEKPVQILQTVEAKFPHELTAKGIREGEVRAVLIVDADGKLSDCLITAYTHPEFAIELLNAVRSWEYIPAKQNGEPTGQRIQIVFYFNQKGAIVSMLPAMAIASSLNRFIQTPLTWLVCKASELDQVPVARERVSPRHPGKSMNPPASNGSATIDFYIDAEGRPRMPVVMKASHEEFAVAAAEALLNWRFDPPTYRGRPIAVRMMQEFIF
jgi:outer membrane biosynthesis protein TonB